jgi:hypothetical protein
VSTQCSHARQGTLPGTLYSFHSHPQRLSLQARAPSTSFLPRCSFPPLTTFHPSLIVLTSASSAPLSPSPPLSASFNLSKLCCAPFFLLCCYSLAHTAMALKRINKELSDLGRYVLLPFSFPQGPHCSHTEPFLHFLRLPPLALCSDLFCSDPPSSCSAGPIGDDLVR